MSKRYTKLEAHELVQRVCNGQSDDSILIDAWLKSQSDFDTAVVALKEIANRPSVGCQCGENSGLNSTEVNIARAALDALGVEWGSQPENGNPKL